MEKDFEGLGIGGKDDKLRLATVQGLGGFVGSFAHLLVVGSLLDQVKDFTVLLVVSKVHELITFDSFALLMICLFLD